jgi:hypothetical protein
VQDKRYFTSFNDISHPAAFFHSVCRFEKHIFVHHFEIPRNYLQLSKSCITFQKISSNLFFFTLFEYIFDYNASVILIVVYLDFISFVEFFVSPLYYWTRTNFSKNKKRNIKFKNNTHLTEGCILHKLSVY